MNATKVPGTSSGSGPDATAPSRFLAPSLCAAVVIAILAPAAALRLTSLGNRPMHCDEAVHADKFRLLLEHGDYAYNPYEFHGPSLNFLTLPIARLAGAKKLAEVTETHLRLVPALFGIALVAMVWLLRAELGSTAVLCAAVLTAASPAMVFFSRYYIQEMLLVGFSFAAMVALWRFGQGAADCAVADGHPEPAPSAVPGARPRLRPWLRQGMWLILLGLSIGMMHATKETCVIPLAAMMVATVLTITGLRRMGAKRLARAGLVVLLTAAGVSAVLFSGLFSHGQGVIDSVMAYRYYFERAAGEGTEGPHAYPWYHYFRILFCWRQSGGPIWSEAPIAVLAVVGLVAGLWGKGLKPREVPLVRFLGVYTVLITVVYSAVSYKTPWCALGMLHGMILLAGVGMVVLIRAAPGRALKAAVIALLVAATAGLAWEAHRASFVMYEDPGNPYVYAHTTGDVPLLAERIRQIAEVQGDGLAMHIQVICPHDDHWPLPWYLRDFSRVDWFPGIPRGPAAPLIITQPSMKDPVLSYAYENHIPGHPIIRQSLRKEDGGDWQLRPNVPLLVIVRRDLLEAYDDAQIGNDATEGRAGEP